MSKLLYNGVNPVVDLVVVRTKMNPYPKINVLLIKRSCNSDAEPGKWALPGGFQNTNAPIGRQWNDGSYQEEPNTAALRECKEETGLDINALENKLKLINVYDKIGRDPRDSQERFTRSHAFFISLDGFIPISKSDGISGLDDAIESSWVCWGDLGSIDLAFNHAQILKDAEKFLSKSLINSLKINKTFLP